MLFWDLRKRQELLKVVVKLMESREISESENIMYPNVHV